MPPSPHYENPNSLADERYVAQFVAFDWDLLAEVGNRLAVRRRLCQLSKQQLAARLGIDAAELFAHEQGRKRMSCKLLFEVAKQLNVAPRFFFH
jgi:DNA-binding XRE family transcriptional regulator